MEETNPGGTSSSKRKPFLDLSNTKISSSLPSSQSSTSSSLLKPQTESSLSWALKSILKSNPNSSLNSNPEFTAAEFTANENVYSEKKKKEDKENVQTNKAKPSSMLSPLPETPFSSVYSRRLAAEKRKGKGKDIAEEPLRFSLETSTTDNKKIEDEENVQSNKAKPSSMLSPLPETPSASVYSRRHTAEKRKSKGKEIVEDPLTFSLETSITDLSDSVNNDKKKKQTEESLSNKANASSMPSLPSKTPHVSGIGDCGFESSPVYNRRHTAERGKRKGKEIAEPLSCSFETRKLDLRKRKDGDGATDLVKSCPLPNKKKQRRAKAEVNASPHDLPPDFIEKQRAYFAEVDAFELEEEEASVDELE